MIASEGDRSSSASRSPFERTVLGERLEPLPERRLVVRLDGLRDLLVELLEPRGDRVVDAPLALAEQAHDHGFGSSPPASSFGASPCPISAFIFASWSSTSLDCEICASWRSMSSPDEV